MESKSELKIVVAYLAILGANVLGIDVQQIILLLADAETYVKDIRELVTASSSKDIEMIVGGLASMVYTIARTWKKTQAGV